MTLSKESAKPGTDLKQETLKYNVERNRKMRTLPSDADGRTWCDIRPMSEGQLFRQGKQERQRVVNE